MSENKNAKTPTDGGAGFIDGVWHGPTAWQCQCGKAYTLTCISSKPAKQWVGLTDEEIITHFQTNVDIGSLLSFVDGARYAEAKLKEKNCG